MNMSSERKDLCFSKKLKVLKESEGKIHHPVAEQFGGVFLQWCMVQCTASKNID